MKRKVAVIPVAKSKNKRTFQVVLNAGAMAVLRSVKGQDDEFVFTYKGEPIKSYKSAWKRAVKDAELAPLRFHDLRHTWASWHVQNGTPLAVLQELGGWRSQRMVQRYAHFGESHLADWSKNAGTSVARRKRKGKKRGRK